MSELLDKQVYVLNECLKYKFRDSCQGVTQAHEKCTMKIKESRKKTTTGAYIFDGRKEGVYKARTENSCHGYQVNDSSYIEGTSYLFSKRVNRCQKDGFSSMGARMDAIKLAMAGT